jgi:hypothetical protein
VLIARKRLEDEFVTALNEKVLDSELLDQVYERTAEKLKELFAHVSEELRLEKVELNRAETQGPRLHPTAPRLDHRPHRQAEPPARHPQRKVRPRAPAADRADHAVAAEARSRQALSQGPMQTPRPQPAGRGRRFVIALMDAIATNSNRGMR